MPVQKFKTFEDAREALWNFHPDEAYYKQVAELWNTADKISPIKYPRGIFKFKTIEDANKHRRDIEIANAREILKKRKLTAR